MTWNKSKLIPESEIKSNITETTVAFAKEFGQYLGKDIREDDKNPKSRIIESKLTTNQLRRFFGEVKRQQMHGYNKTEFLLLKPKLAYAVGRAEANKSSKIKDFYYVISDAIDKVSDEKSFQNFIMIFEAIVAYHKAAEEDLIL